MCLEHIFSISIFQYLMIWGNVVFLAEQKCVIAPQSQRKASSRTSFFHLVLRMTTHEHPTKSSLSRINIPRCLVVSEWLIFKLWQIWYYYNVQLNVLHLESFRHCSKLELMFCLICVFKSLLYVYSVHIEAMILKEEKKSKKKIDLSKLYSIL